MGEFPRRPTKEERDLLDFVVEANPDHAAALHSLFRNTQVTQLCSCGCGSPHFSVDTSDVRKRIWPHPLPEEAVALVEGALMMAMLWADLDGGNLEIN